MSSKIPTKQIPAVCPICSQNYTKKYKNNNHCSFKCRRKASEKQRQLSFSLGVQNGLPSGDVGAIGELKVATELMTHGVPVFRALSPSCRADLTILVKNDHGNDLAATVEVRTARRSLATGYLSYGPRQYEADIAALVIHGEGIEYLAWSDLGKEVLPHLLKRVSC